MFNQKEGLIDLLTDTLSHCNNPLQNVYDEIVEELAEYLIENNVVVLPYDIGDTVYYITGINNKLVKSAKIKEIFFDGDSFAFYVNTDNYTYFTLQEDEVFLSKSDAENEIMKRADNNVI